MTSGIDVSHFQSVTDTTTAIKAGAAFVIAKATQGPDKIDGRHDQHVAATRAAGRVVGHYHFAEPGDPGAQAAWFLQHAGYQPGDLLALDIEDAETSPGSGVSIWKPYGWPYRSAWAQTFLEHVTAVAAPLLYLNHSWLNGLMSAPAWAALAHYRLWVAYPAEPGHPGVNGWALHQYAATGGIDRDYLNPALTLEQLTGADVALTQVDADLIAKTLAGNQDFLRSVANSVWLSGGGLPENYRQQLVDAIKAALPPGSGLTLDQIQAAVKAANATLVLVPQA